MTYAKKTLLTVLFVGLGVFVSAPAEANDVSAIKEISNDVLVKMRLLNQELPQYRRTPQYDLLRDEVREIRRLTSRIRGWSHNVRNLPRIEEELGQLDFCFLRLRRLFRATEQQSCFRSGPLRGVTARVRSLLNATDHCIQLMQREVARLNRQLYGRRGYWAEPIYRDNIGSCDNGRRTLDRRSWEDQFRGYPYTYSHGYSHGGRTAALYERDFRGGRGVHLDRQGVSIGNENLRFRINF